MRASEVVTSFELTSRKRLSAAARELLSPTVICVSQAIALIALAMQIVNALGFLPAARAGIYFLALVPSLAIGALVFVRTVFIRPGDPDA